MAGEGRGSGGGKSVPAHATCGVHTYAGYCPRVRSTDTTRSTSGVKQTATGHILAHGTYGSTPSWGVLPYVPKAAPRAARQKCSKAGSLDDSLKRRFFLTCHARIIQRTLQHVRPHLFGAGFVMLMMLPEVEGIRSISGLMRPAYQTSACMLQRGW